MVPVYTGAEEKPFLSRSAATYLCIQKGGDRFAELSDCSRAHRGREARTPDPGIQRLLAGGG